VSFLSEPIFFTMIQHFRLAHESAGMLNQTRNPLFAEPGRSTSDGERICHLEYGSSATRM
jgi:hypothetical protein